MEGVSYNFYKLYTTIYCQIVTETVLSTRLLKVDLNPINPFPSYRSMLGPLQQTTFEKIVTKGKIAHDEQFLL